MKRHSPSILSLLFAEPASDEILIAISNNDCAISAGNYLETAIVVDSVKGPVATRKFDAFIKESGLEILSVDAKQVGVARVAYRVVYALAATTKRKLLYKGDDFRHTDTQFLISRFFSSPFE